MKFSYDWVQELSGVSLSAQEAADILTAKSFEVEDVSAEGIMEVKVLPNRPDCLSHLGIARELCALTNSRFAAPAYEYKVDEHPTLSIRIEDAVGCPRYSALTVRGVTVGASPEWLRNRLEQCGLKSINNVVDVTNYVMLELGQPMHAFDKALLDGIVVRRARAGETLHALDEARTEYALDESMLVIADNTKAIAIAGIKGGAGTGISNATQDITLEAANFDPGYIRATSRKLGLKTDASIRFSYGVDANLTAAALIRAAELLQKVAGGAPDKEITDIYPVHRTAHTVMLDPGYVRALLGADIGDGQIRSILNAFGFEVVDHDDRMQVTVPTRRLDVSTPEDLAEEVGRTYGYEAIPPVPPSLPIFEEKSWVKEDAEGVAWDEYGFIRERNALGQMLAGAGYSEVYNYAFVSDELKEVLKLTGLSELAQPQSSEYRWLRRSLVPRLLVNARDNLRFADEVKIFETGHVYDHIGQGRESTRLGMTLARKNGSELFYELKGAVDLLLERLGIVDYYYDDAAPFVWDDGAVHATVPGQQALIRLEGDGHVIGFIGVVSSVIATAYKLKGSAVIAELCLRSLVRHAQREREFEPLPKYPSVVHDIAMLVDADTKIDSIIETIQESDDADIVRDVDVFDIFLPTGKEKLKEEGDTPQYAKSVAVHVTYRANDHTLTDEEVLLVEDGIKKALQEKLSAIIR
jgi:phenylalanyl-tRNA synthetase beta chain